jgi:polar amino acid transport system permease protein
LRIQRAKITPLDIALSLLIVGAGIFLSYRIRAEVHYEWNWSIIPQYLFYFNADSGGWHPNLLIQGFFTTIRLSVWGTILATLLGILLGFCRLSQRLFYRLIGRTYVELIRNIPPLVLIFIFYFFVSDQIMPVIGVDGFIRTRSDSTQKVLAVLFAPPSRFSAFLSAVITLALFEGAYITEIVRAGIQSIEKGQWEAAYALGLSWRHQMSDVIMPQAVHRILPPMAGQLISTVKDSAIVSVISIQELTFQGMELMSATYLTFEIWITVTLLYLVLTLSLSLAVERLEIRMHKRY